MGVRRLVASETERPVVSWPSASFAARRAAAANEGLLSAWRRSVSPAVHSTASSAAPSQLLPFLLTVLGPALRTMSVHAMAPAEKAALGNLVDTMVCYGAPRACSIVRPEHLADAARAGLGYTARSGSDAQTGAYSTELVLDPPVDTLLRFEALAHDEAPQRRTLPPALRQVVAHECVVEHIKRGDAARAARGAAAAEAAGDDPNATQPPPPGTRVRYLVCVMHACGADVRRADGCHASGQVQERSAAQGGGQEAHRQARAACDLALRCVALTRAVSPAVRRRCSPQPFTSSTRGACLLAACAALLVCSHACHEGTPTPCAAPCAWRSCCEARAACCEL